MASWSALRFALRQLRKSPGFTLVVIATLALCIGVNTAVFSVLDALLLRPAPYPEAHRLALLVTASWGAGAEDVNTSQTGALFEAVRDFAPALDTAAAAGSGGANFTGSGHSEYIQQQRVSAGFFHVLGISPWLGREFTRQEDVPGGPAIAVLSFRFWQRAFHGDPAVLGQAIRLKGEDYTVTGIMPRDFRSTAPVDVWTPLRPSRNGEGGGSNYLVIARLRPGVSWGAASKQLRALSRTLNQDRTFPREVKDFEERILPLQAALTDDVRDQLLIAWVAVLLVLLIGCVNIAGLLLARSGARSREVATRMALGGSRAAIVRQLLVESLLLSLAGGLAGIAAGGFALDYLKQLGASEYELWHPIQLDARVLAVMLGIALLTALLFGLAPALRTTRLDIRSVLIEGGRGIAGGRRQWTSEALVAAEISLSVILLVGAGLMVRSLAWLNHLDPGFDTHNVIAAEASLQDARYRTTTQVNRLYTQTLESIRRIPGVQSAAVALTLPYERPLNNGFHTIDGSDREDHTGEVVYVTPAYLETLRIPLRAGRSLRDSDTAKSAPIAIVSQTFAAKYFATTSTVGGHLDLGGGSREIVGVVGDVQLHSGITQANGILSHEPTIYVPVTQTKDAFLQLVHTWFSPKWVVRSAGPTTNLNANIQAAIASIDPQLPIAHFRTVEDLRGIQTVSQRFLASLFSILAALATLLATIGLYGLISQTVARRRYEIGIRMALGATARQTIESIVWPGILLAFVGIAAGVGMSLFAVRFLQSLLWGVRGTDPATFVSTAAVLLAVAALASLAPALRILRVDPAETLRNQ